MLEDQLVTGHAQRGEIGDGLAPGDGVFRRAQPLHEAQAMGIAAADRFGSDEDGAGGRAADEGDQAVDGPPVDHDPELGGGHAETAMGVATRRSQAAASWRPGAEGGAFDGGDGGRRQLRDPIEHGPQRGGEAGALHAGQIGAGAERAIRAHQDEGPHLALDGLVQRGPDGDQRLVIDGVAALRPVDRDDTHRPTPVGVDHRALTLLEHGHDVALLDLVLGDDAHFLHDGIVRSRDRDLHLHRLEDDELVALGDSSPGFDTDLPHVGGDLGADLGHGGGG